MIFLVYILLFHCSVVWLCCSAAICDIQCTSMARYSLFVLKVLLNNNKPNQTISISCSFSWMTAISLDSWKGPGTPNQPAELPTVERQWVFRLSTLMLQCPLSLTGTLEDSCAQASSFFCPYTRALTYHPSMSNLQKNTLVKQNQKSWSSWATLASLISCAFCTWWWWWWWQQI